LNLTGAATLSGGGVVALATATGGGSAIISGSGQTLTNSGDVIEGTGTIGGNSNLAVINSGTIDANSSAGTKTLILNGSVTNSKLLEATGGGTLQLQSVTVNDAGGAITANGGVVQVNGSTIQGGTLNTLGGGTLETAPGFNSTLDGSTHGALTISAGSTYTSSNTAVTNILGTIADKGTIQVNGGSGANGSLNLTGAATLSGGGVVALATATGGGSAIISGSGQTLTNSGDVIEGTGTIGGNSNLAVINSGTIDANSAAGTGTLILSGFGAFTNTGVFEATNGGHLDVADALGGAGQLEIGASSEVELGGATSENSTFLSASSAKLRIDNATTTTYSGVINSFVKGDIVELGSTNATSATPTFNSGPDTTTLTVDLGGGSHLLYTLAGNLSADTFSVTHVNGGADSDIAIATTAAMAQAISLLGDPMSNFVDSSNLFGGTQSNAQLNLAGSLHSHS
jgi:hypothetical protein